MRDNLKTMHEHTVDISLLTGGIVIDAGCRGFLFSKEMKSLGEKVYAFDLEDFSDVPEGISYIKAAILDKTGCVKYVNTHDQQAKHIHENGTIEVEGISINLLLSLLGNDIDVLKLDIEGQEIPVILSMKQPIAKSLSVEFHLHTGTPMYQVRAAMNHLHEIGYRKVYEDYSEKYGLQRNFWDCLFVRQDLIK